MSAKQRLLNESWEHIVAQGGPSIQEDENKYEPDNPDYYDSSACRYRGENGIGCAMAPAIMDYDPRMETLGAGNLLQDFSDNLHPWVRNINEHFANEIQSAHDNTVAECPRDHFMAEFKEAMRCIAARHNLVCPS